MNTLNTQRTPNSAPLTQTPAEFGFIHQEQGPVFMPKASDLPDAYQGLINQPLSTQLLVTDQNNPVLVTSIVGRHNRAASIASDTEPNASQHRYSDDIQAYFLKGVKKFTDESPAVLTTAKQNGSTVYYEGNVGVTNGRLLRVYFAPIGSIEGVSVIAKVGASRTREAQVKLYRTLFDAALKP